MTKPRVRSLFAAAVSTLLWLITALDAPAQGLVPSTEAESASVDDAAAPEFLRARPDFEWSFPRDHFRHDGYRTEWWYFTGHLASSDGARFGYQFTFFRIALNPGEWTRDASSSAWDTNALVMGHASVSSLDTGEHVFSELLYRESPLLAGFSSPGDVVDELPVRVGWARAPAGTEEPWTLDWNGDGFAFSMVDRRQGVRFALETRSRKPMVFQGPNGFSRKGRAEEAASQYYSFTRLDTEGVLELGGVTHEVTGQSWMDKEFSSSQLTSGQVGWDWFSLQLDNGSELMLYRLRRADGSTDYQNATFVPTNGEPRYLLDDSEEAWSLEVTGSWTSPETGATYPSGWRLDAFGQSLEVRPLVQDQENRSRIPGGVFYWEGAVQVLSDAGEVLGSGYVELTGYGENNRPPV